MKTIQYEVKKMKKKLNISVSASIFLLVSEKMCSIIIIACVLLNTNFTSNIFTALIFP